MFVDNEISQVAGAMHAMSLHDQQQQQQQFTPSFTLASIGTWRHGYQRSSSILTPKQVLSF